MLYLRMKRDDIYVENQHATYMVSDSCVAHLYRLLSCSGGPLSSLWSTGQKKKVQSQAVGYLDYLYEKIGDTLYAVVLADSVSTLMGIYAWRQFCFVSHYYCYCSLQVSL